MDDDVQHIDATLNGQPAAFGLLVKKYQQRLYNALIYTVGHAEDARDIVQDAFVQAYVRLDTFRRDSAFFTWLYRIAFNAAATRRRRQHATLSVERLRETDGMDPVDQGAGPADRIEEAERSRKVHEALAELPEEFRTVLVLREIEGHDYDAIAEILDLPVGTVRSRLHRGRIQLREKLISVLREEGP